MTVCQAVSKRIKDLLKEKRMTQYRLEKKSNVLHGSLNCIMRCKNKTVNLNTIMMIAKGFDMSVLEFLNDPVFFSEELEIEY
ncbi:MAG: helix-turn-helix transcriptional regulator [Clostridia bacterium]|nr:helix-turn-helix transcriptional regulator [Clostridia bacterium]